MSLILIITTALTGFSLTEAGLLRHSRIHSILPLGRASDGVCLNGGTSIPAVLNGQHMFCLCVDGFEGKHCEHDVSATCYEGVGLYYKGTVSRSESGRKCEKWDPETRKRFMKSDVKSGRHNYCRNLEYKRRPWCYVMKADQLVKESCNIPRCGMDTRFEFETHDLPQHQPTTVPKIDSTCGQRSQKQPIMKIVGGTLTAVEKHPWIAAIFWKGRKEKVFRCGGSLISPCWVITAAHCFPDGDHTNVRKLSVVLGKKALNETDEATEQLLRVTEVFIHPDFDNTEGNFNNDIALMRLASKDGQCAQETPFVRTVCLPPAGKSLVPSPKKKPSCHIVGYGKEKEGLWYNSQYLREAKVELLAQDTCRGKEYYGNMITDNMFCAGHPDWSQDACKGDSGGPLVCEVDKRMFLFGIISWGDGCAREHRPGVYTTVTNYNQWIEEKINLPSVTSGSMFPIK